MEEIRYSGIFDSHAHYNDERFDPDREELLASLPNLGVCGVINAGTNLESSLISAEYAKQYGYFYAAVGYHPEQAAEYTEEGMAKIFSLLDQPKIVAIGEIGLDYYWPEPDREIQKKVFRIQLAAAKERNIPVIIHSRDATEDTLRILREFPGVRGVLHCFSGSAETAKELVKIGFYLGFTGVLTFPNGRRAAEACSVIPTERLLLETDCPYMAPVPYRGKRCFSPMIARTAEKMAEIKGLSPQQMIDTARENTLRLFSIKL